MGDPLDDISSSSSLSHSNLSSDETTLSSESSTTFDEQESSTAIDDQKSSTTLDDQTGFFIWEESTSDSILEYMIAQGYTSFRMRDIIFMQNSAAYTLFQSYGDELDILVSIPAIDYWPTEHTTNIDSMAAIVNANPFIKRLQIYPLLQPGLNNPSELDPCKDWLTGYADTFEERIRAIDTQVINKDIEIVIAGQMGTPGCSDLTQIINTLYDLQDNGRKVAWGHTVYPFFYRQDTTWKTLDDDITDILKDLAQYAPEGQKVLPFRAIETGWPSSCLDYGEYYIDTATPENQCGFTQTALNYKREGVKLYLFSLADNPDGWAQCELHFGLWDSDGALKCPL